MKKPWFEVDRKSLKKLLDAEKKAIKAGKVEHVSSATDLPPLLARSS